MAHCSDEGRKDLRIDHVLYLLQAKRGEAFADLFALFLEKVKKELRKKRIIITAIINSLA